jgi:hypothetical protein
MTATEQMTLDGLKSAYNTLQELTK